MIRPHEVALRAADSGPASRPGDRRRVPGRVRALRRRTALREDDPLAATAHCGVPAGTPLVAEQARPSRHGHGPGTRWCSPHRDRYANVRSEQADVQNL